MDEISMPVQVLLYVVTSLFSAGCAAGAAYYAVKVKLGYVEESTKENKADIKQLRTETNDELGRVHSRINRVLERLSAAGATTRNEP